MDFTDIFKPGALEKDMLGGKIDAYFSRTLKVLQILKLTQEVYGEEEAERIGKSYKPALDLLMENMSKDIQEYQDKHGEL